MFALAQSSSGLFQGFRAVVRALRALLFQNRPPFENKSFQILSLRLLRLLTIPHWVGNMAAVAARRLALLGTGIFGAYTVRVTAQQTPQSSTESAARSRFQYVGYDPKSDTAIVQFVGSKTASMLPAEDLMQMGLKGTPRAVCSALRSQGTLLLQPPRLPPFPLSARAHSLRLMLLCIVRRLRLWKTQGDFTQLQVSSTFPAPAVAVPQIFLMTWGNFA
jgi:hypothetical protein